MPITKNIKTNGVELTEAINSYVSEKLLMVEKLIGESVAIADVEVAKETRHHKSGELFRAEINLQIDGDLLRATKTKDDLYAAIDLAKDELAQELRKRLKRKHSLFRRGGRVIKNMLKGFYRGKNYE